MGGPGLRIFDGGVIHGESPDDPRGRASPAPLVTAWSVYGWTMLVEVYRPEAYRRLAEPRPPGQANPDGSITVLRPA